MADDTLAVLLALEAADRASSVINNVGRALADLRLKMMAVTGASEEEQAAAGKTTNLFKDMNPAMLAGMVAAAGLAVGLGAVAVKSVEVAGSYQQSITALQTGAGEFQKNMSTVTSGVLDMSGEVGVGAQKLANDLYAIESAGFHGANGLQVLRVSEEAAKADMADAGTVADALTTKLVAYGEGSDKATSSANQMVTAVALGKMHMQDFAGSLSAVLPVGAAVNLQFAQIAGAEATMTAQGMTAQQSAQDLANTIRSLSAPNNVAVQEMQQMGLSSVDLAQHLGDRGLTGTLDLLSKAVTDHMGPDGLVMMSTFRDSRVAAQDANAMIAAMPANLQGLAQGFLQGSVSAKQWRQELLALSPEQQHLMQQFAATAEKANSFNQLLASGSPAAQTYAGAMEKMLGGSTGLNTALMLTGGHAETFASNVDAISKAGQKGGKDIADWAVIQGNFNQQMDQAKASIGAAGIALGMGLLPPLTQVVKAVVPVVQAITTWISHNQAWAAGIAIAVIALSALGAVILGLTIIVGAFALVELAVLWPIALIVIAIVALVAVIILLATHWNQITGFFQGVWHAAITKVGEGFSWLGTQAHNFIGVIVGFFAGIIAKAQAGWQEFARHPLYWIGFMVAFIPIKLAQLAAEFLGWAGSMISNAEAWRDRMIERALAAGVGFIAALEVEIPKLPGQLWSWLLGALAQAAAWAVELEAKGRTGASNFGQAVLSEIGKLPGQMVQVGEDIIRGVIEGIANLKGWAQGQVGEAIQGMIAGAKAAAGIHSPSELFAAEIGEPIAQGIGVGISRGTPSAQASITGMVSTLAGAETPRGGSSGNMDDTNTLLTSIAELLTDIRDHLDRPGPQGTYGRTSTVRAAI